ncbi:S24/S26 family peptidase [Candidatus Methanarcanum hacksteinii]|uniref:S24/S26 family peptidase n=1 Tax=Candidatus Methanarcanum hacksteinii TaxID=2911857 RepID=UPI0037DC3761
MRTVVLDWENGQDGLTMPEDTKEKGWCRRYLPAILVILLVALSAYALYYLNGDSFDLKNREFIIVVTGSMDGEDTGYEIGSIPVDSLIVVERVGHDRISSLEIGDVVAYRNGSMLIVHRLVSIDNDNETMVLKGDVNTSAETVSFSDVVGKVVDVHPAIGKAMTLLRTKAVFILVELACLALVLSSIREIIQIVREED